MRRERRTNKRSYLTTRTQAIPAKTKGMKRIHFLELFAYALIALFGACYVEIKEEPLVRTKADRLESSAYHWITKRDTF